MNKIITLLFSVFYLGNISFAQNATDKIVLKKDQKLEIFTISNGTVNMQMMGQDMETTSETSVTSTIQVKDITPAGYMLTNSLNKMKLKTKGGMAPAMDFDSDKKGDMESEIGKSVKDKLKATDEEITFAGKAVEKKDAKADNEDMQKVMQSIMSGSGENGVTGLFMIIPAGKKAGDIWSDSSNKNGVKIYNNYSLKKLNGNEATVITSSTSGIDKTVQAQGTDITISMNSKITSESVIDITTGLIQEKKTTVEGQGNLGAGGQDIPLKTKVTATTTVKSI